MGSIDGYVFTTNVRTFLIARIQLFLLVTMLPHYNIHVYHSTRNISIIIYMYIIGHEISLLSDIVNTA